MNITMLLLGIVALVGGLVAMVRRGGTEQAIYARRIAGTMGAALGAALIIFAIGLAGID